MYPGDGQIGCSYTGSAGGPIWTEMPTPICAADGEERTTGITNSKNPKARKRNARCTVIFRFLEACGLA